MPVVVVLIVLVIVVSVGAAAGSVWSLLVGVLAAIAVATALVGIIAGVAAWRSGSQQDERRGVGRAAPMRDRPQNW
jgi:uncharacterized membrane protein